MSSVAAFGRVDTVALRDAGTLERVTGADVFRATRTCFAVRAGAGAALTTSRLTSTGNSRRTSPGSTSSRNPRKTGWRITPSRVHSLNLTSTTNFGFTHVGFSLACGGGPLNGGDLMMSGFISL